MLRHSSRIKVCSSNLGRHIDTVDKFLYQFMPAVHVGFVIDGVEESADGGNGHGILSVTKDQGQRCMPVPVLKNQSDSLAIEKLQCLNSTYSQTDRFHLFKYNCGGYTKDLLHSAGLGYPALLNWGIGSRLKFGVDSHALELARITCDHHIHKFRELISHLESGVTIASPPRALEVMNDSQRKSRDGQLVFSHDALLQIVLSAARGKNDANRRWVKKALLSRHFSSLYLDSNEKISRAHKKSLHEFFRYTDAESLSWIEKNFPGVFELYQAVRRSQ